ncbi:MAG: hypothetical protein ACRDSL_17540 [Pseudonocardiaceae bacterium]
MNSIARRRLDYADALLTGSELAGLWPRCTTWLIRLALEHALNQLWAATHPAIADCTRRAQLLALGAVVDADTQHRVHESWTTLSRAGHHHHYELAPTAAELQACWRKPRYS